MKGVIRFGMKGKLSPRYIIPYEILIYVGVVAYELDLLSELPIIHLVFHMSMLKKFIKDPSLIVPVEVLE